MPADAKEVEYVELSGGVGRIIHQTVVRTFRTSEFLEKARQTGGVETDFLPHGCVLYKDGNYPEDGAKAGPAGAHYRLYVCARHPRIATIRFRGVDVGEDPKAEETRRIRTFALAMPWIVTFVLYQNSGLALVYVAAAMKDVASTGKGTALYRLPLPNMNAGHFCLGELVLESSQPFHIKTNRVLQYIDESVWNNDLWPVFGEPKAEALASPAVFSIRHWAEMTEKHGQGFWHSLNPIPFGVAIENLIRRFTR